jgi:hypothetical protein
VARRLGLGPARARGVLPGRGPAVALDPAARGARRPAGAGMARGDGRLRGRAPVPGAFPAPGGRPPGCAGRRPRHRGGGRYRRGAVDLRLPLRAGRDGGVPPAVARRRARARGPLERPLRRGGLRGHDRAGGLPRRRPGRHDRPRGADHLHQCRHLHGRGDHRRRPRRALPGEPRRAGELAAGPSRSPGVQGPDLRVGRDRPGRARWPPRHHRLQPGGRGDERASSRTGDRPPVGRDPRARGAPRRRGARPRG